MKKVFFTLLMIAMIASFAMVPAFAATAPEDIADDAVMYKLDMDNYTVWVDFEDCLLETEEYGFTGAGDLGSGGISFIDAPYSYIMVGRGEDAISGEQSLKIKGYLDSRRWSLSLLEGEGDYVFIEYKIKPIGLGAAGSTLFYVCITDPDVEGTNSEGSGGKIGEVLCGETLPYIVNNAGETVYEFPRMNETYTVAFAVNYSTDEYDVYVDGVRVSTGNHWVGELNGINAVRWDMHGAFGDTAAIQADTREIIVDDFIITYGDQISKADYFATPTPTPEPTPEPTPTPEATAAPEATKAPEGGNTGDDKPADDGKKGCGSVVVSSAIVASMTLLAAAVVLKKKH